MRFAQRNCVDLGSLGLGPLSLLTPPLLSLSLFLRLVRLISPSSLSFSLLRILQPLSLSPSSLLFPLTFLSLLSLSPFLPSNWVPQQGLANPLWKTFSI